MNLLEPSKKPELLTFELCQELGLTQQRKIMDTILNNPGLQHIAEDIFLNLDEKSLTNNCTSLNQNAKKIINRPMFWLKKLSQMKSFSNYIEPWKALICKLYRSQNLKKVYFFGEKMQKTGLVSAFLWHHFPFLAPSKLNVEQALTMKLKKMYVKKYIQSPLTLALQMAIREEHRGLIEFILENVDSKRQSIYVLATISLANHYCNTSTQLSQACTDRKKIPPQI